MKKWLVQRKMLATGLKSVDPRGAMSSFSGGQCRPPSRIHDDNLRERKSMSDASERTMKFSTLGNRITTFSRIKTNHNSKGNDESRRPLSRELSSNTRTRQLSANIIARKPTLKTEEQTPKKLFIKPPTQSIDRSEYESSGQGMAIRNILRASMDKNPIPARKGIKKQDEPIKETGLENRGRRTEERRPISVKIPELGTVPFHLPKNCISKPDPASQQKPKICLEKDRKKIEPSTLTQGANNKKRPPTSGQTQFLQMLGKVPVSQQ